MPIEPKSELILAMRFASVGVVSTLTHLICAHAVLLFFGVSLVAANAVGFLFAFVVSFLGHHHYSFPKNSAFWRSFRRYGVISVLGFVMNSFILLSLVQLDMLSPATSLTIAIFIVPLCTFLASRLWGFNSGG
ncbi:MAG: GtrA family protein [Pseudomonadota bacterium]